MGDSDTNEKSIDDSGTTAIFPGVIQRDVTQSFQGNYVAGEFLADAIGATLRYCTPKHYVLTMPLMMQTLPRGEYCTSASKEFSLEDVFGRVYGTRNQRLIMTVNGILDPSFDGSVAKAVLENRDLPKDLGIGHLVLRYAREVMKDQVPRTEIRGILQRGERKHVIHQGGLEFGESRKSEEESHKEEEADDAPGA